PPCRPLLVCSSPPQLCPAGSTLFPYTTLFRSCTGTGLPQPMKNQPIEIITMPRNPNGSKWAMGFRVMRPRSRAVLSPSLCAVHACMNSWMVPAITYDMRIAMMSSTCRMVPIVNSVVVRRTNAGGRNPAGPRSSVRYRFRLCAGAGVQVACHEVAVALVREDRVDLLADVHHVRAARVEVATGWRVDRARNVTRQDDALTPLLDHRVRDRHRRQESLRVRVQRIGVERIAASRLDALAEVHHGHAIGDVAHD